MRRALVVLAFVAAPGVAAASVAAVAGADGTLSAVAAFAGAFAGNVVRDVLWLRKHERDCPARNRKEV